MDTSTSLLMGGEPRFSVGDTVMEDGVVGVVVKRRGGDQVFEYLVVTSLGDRRWIAEVMLTSC